MNLMVIPIVTGTLGIVTGTGELGNKRTNTEHPNYRIVDMSQNTKKCPGVLRTLAVTQSLLGNNQQTLV